MRDRWPITKHFLAARWNPPRSLERQFHLDAVDVLLRVAGIRELVGDMRVDSSPDTPDAMVEEERVISEPMRLTCDVTLRCRRVRFEGLGVIICCGYRLAIDPGVEGLWPWGDHDRVWGSVEAVRSEFARHAAAWRDETGTPNGLMRIVRLAVWANPAIPVELGAHFEVAPSTVERWATGAARPHRSLFPAIIDECCSRVPR